MGSIQERFGDESVVFRNLAAFSFDGASVMIGSENSVASRFLSIAPQAIGIHAVAHRLESAYGDAWAVIAFLEVIGELVRDCFSLACRTLT